MGTQREFPIDPSWLGDDDGTYLAGYWVHRSLQKKPPADGRYDTEIERMLVERPDGIHASSTPTLEETLGIKEILGAAIEALEPEERWIAERLLIEGLSLRKAGAVLGCPKSTLARKRDAIRSKLIKTLAVEPVITRWLGQSKEALILHGETLSNHSH